MIGVTWYEANAYCRWLTEKLRQGKNPSCILPPSSFVRLPTKSEWVRAAGGDANKRYVWDKSEIENPASKIENVLARANVKESGLEGTTPVAMYLDGARVVYESVLLSEWNDPRPSKQLIFDLAGNVWEWTSDLYEPYSAAHLRGGSWYNGAESVCASARNSRYYRESDDDNGLRVVAAL